MEDATLSHRYCEHHLVHHSKSGSPMSQSGHNRTSLAAGAMSAIPPKPDMDERGRHVGLVPRSDIARYSITSSARSKIDVGSVTPIAFAAFKLTTNSNWLTCSTGKSAGLAPRRILAVKEAARRIIGTKLTP